MMRQVLIHFFVSPDSTWTPWRSFLIYLIVNLRTCIRKYLFICLFQFRFKYKRIRSINFHFLRILIVFSVETIYTSLLKYTILFLIFLFWIMNLFSLEMITIPIIMKLIRISWLLMQTVNRRLEYKDTILLLIIILLLSLNLLRIIHLFSEAIFYYLFICVSIWEYIIYIWKLSRTCYAFVFWLEVLVVFCFLLLTRRIWLLRERVCLYVWESVRILVVLLEALLRPFFLWKLCLLTSRISQYLFYMRKIIIMHLLLWFI